MTCSSRYDSREGAVKQQAGDLAVHNILSVICRVELLARDGARSLRSIRYRV